MTGPALGRRLGTRAVGPDDAWAIGYALALIIVPILLHALLGGTDLRLATPVVTAAIAIAGFVVRPTRAIVVIALWTVFIDTLEVAAGAEVKYVDELLVPILGVITVVRQRGRIRGAWSWPRELGAAIIVGAGLASSLMADVPLGVWLPGLLLIAKGLGMFYVVRLLDIDEADVRWAMRAVLAVALVVLALGVVEYLVPDWFVGFGVRPDPVRAGLPAMKSVFYHPQLFGWLCGFVALYLFAAHAVTGKRWTLVLALVFSVGTIMSARRRAILAVAGGLASGVLVDVAASRARLAAVRAWLPSAIGMAIVTIAFLPALAGLAALAVEDYVEPLPGGPTIPGGPDDPDDAAGTPARIALYVTSVDIARDHLPLGAGLGRFGSWMSRAEYSPVYAEYGLDGIFGLSRANPQYVTDTFWPQVLGELGVAGLVGYGLFLGSIAVSILVAHVRRDRASPVAAIALLGAGMVAVQTIIESVASPVFNSPPQIYLIMVAIGGTLAWQARAAVDR